MGNRTANPFPEAEWAKEAYQNACYMSVTMGNEFDPNTGEITTKPRFTHNQKPISGSPGQVLGDERFINDIGIVPTETQRLDMAFIMGYMYAQLAGLEKDG